ncbi:amidase domain-containing protein [Metaclostridioides mangenotii]|uniref:amidase domain-containing protein n=1 Tax=Metaclostridioides mangenotii TaxID=1540 RepID=UPI00046570EA|nr:amidase domain-containing protein [Clostridioides mangenotii]
MKKLNLKNKYIKGVVGLVLLVVFFGAGFYTLSNTYLTEESLESSKLIDTKDDKEKDVEGDNKNKLKETKEERKAREEREEYKILLEDLFDFRNKAILNKNEDILKGIFDTDKKFGLWAYEHEIKKMKYLENWSSKQGVKFKNIKTKVNVRKVREREKNLYGVICSVSTEYKYTYANQKDKVNTFRIGTEHYLHVKKVKNKYIITKEWYTDPFADSLNLENIKSDDIRNFIDSKKEIKLNLTPEQKKCVSYAHKYAGSAADEEDGLKFNDNYRNYNPEGGDCANFASQIMFESGRFEKNATWNYSESAGTKAWVNAQAFKNYLLYSGRGSLLTKGTFEEVYKEAYFLRPGDIVGYEKGGRITHVSTVTGLDSKGYPLVTCHNTDRLLVPWDLGWSDKDIKFHIIKVNY